MDFIHIAQIGIEDAEQFDARHIAARTHDPNIVEHEIGERQRLQMASAEPLQDLMEYVHQDNGIHRSMAIVYL